MQYRNLTIRPFFSTGFWYFEGRWLMYGLHPSPEAAIAWIEAKGDLNREDLRRLSQTSAMRAQLQGEFTTRFYARQAVMVEALRRRETPEAAFRAAKAIL